MALVTLGLCLLLSRFPASEATISVDLQASRGKILQVFLNDMTLPPMSRALEPGVRRTYVFDIADDVRLLRVDPTDAAVFIDGEYVGCVNDFGPYDAPLTLPAGYHNVELRARGWQPMRFDITVLAGQVIPYRGTLGYIR